jgi:hypothetical protein
MVYNPATTACAKAFLTYMTVIVSASYVLVANVSSLYFRTHTNLGLQGEVPDDDDNNTVSASHTPSPSLSTSSTVLKRKKHDTSDLCATLKKFIVSHDKSDCENMTQKKQLIVFFEDIAQIMVKFPKVDLTETKREIFNLVNKKEIELLVQKQIHVPSPPHQ